MMRTALIALVPLLLSTSALTDGFDSGGRSVSGGSSTAADGTAFVVESVPGTAASATGTDAIAIGDGAVSGTSADSIAIGVNADATGENSIAIGGDGTDASSADASGTQSVAIGFNTLADATAAVALGDSADAGGNSSVAVGDLASSSGSQSVAIGAGAGPTSGSGGVAIGNNSESTSNDTIAIGRNTDATGENCVAIGGDGTDALSADCSGAQSVALGRAILADDIGEFAFASGQFAAQSDAHTSVFVLRNSTTSATQTELFSDGSAGDISVGSDCTVFFDLSIVARQTDADDQEAGYTIAGVIGNNAGTTALVAAVTTVTVSEDVAGWDVDATADDSNDGLNVLVTGAGSCFALQGRGGPHWTRTSNFHAVNGS